jgi:S-adenosylmethionine-diacylglycerol 3-amino-3-carboxypropyl transferase
LPSSEIAQHASFAGVRYAQVWEDADILLAALAPRPGARVLSIASAGDNALALLLADPAEVVAIDLSAAQLDCLRLRIAAFRQLDHAALLELIGSRPSRRRRQLFAAVVANLPEARRPFWHALADGVDRHGLGGIGRFERYFRLFRRWVLPLAHGRGTVDALLTPRDRTARADFHDRRWNGWRWRLLMRLFFSRLVMGRLGRDPAFFAHVGGSVGAHVARRVRHALVEQEPAANPYLHWILLGDHDAALPLWLRPEHFATIRDRLDRLVLVHGPIEALVADGRRFDAFNLSDIFEYMGQQGFRTAYQALLGLAAPRARLVYWNMMAPRRGDGLSPDRVRRNADIELRLYPDDKAFFYSALVVEDVLG